jgi:mannosyl-glycoprotein endo-beta-N-acetylglucosaminidase
VSFLKRYYVKLHSVGLVALSFLFFVAAAFNPLGLTASADSSISGVALKSPTNVYESTSANSSVLKNYSQGTILTYQPYNDSWYSASVKVNGAWKQGYISKSDVENLLDTTASLKGIATNGSTAVYSKASSNSAVLKSYAEGTLLSFETFSPSWYQAKVYIKGKAVTGYIAKGDVEIPVSNQESLRGLALKSETAVYSKASLQSSKLKSYPVGTKLSFKTFTSEWYEASVYVNGKKRTGYIHRSHVESAASESASYKGAALKGPTSVYKEATRNGGAWKSYGKGTILSYQSFSENWYQATVIVSGKKRTGFIHKDDVENAVDNPQSLSGIGLKSPTVVYAGASTDTKKLKSYAAGSILKYETFLSGWYRATIYVNGKRTYGYIATSHTEGLLTQEQQSLDARALKSPTYIYSKASKSASSLKSYRQDTILNVRTLSPNWFEVTVYIDGKAKTGYVYGADVTTADVTRYTEYNYTFDYMVEQQMKYGGPKADGAGKIAATKEQVAYYANPANFAKGTQAYYQFLDLTQSAGLKAKEINDNILKGKGSLEGTGQAFIDAGKKYGINEAYLIAHTLHETGNGTSTLAKGIMVDGTGKIVTDKSKAVHTVYNMYGYGAKDSCPIDCGAKYAFDQGWFTPEAAILGGAGQVSQNYISRGQDTLYKMKWNPDKPATHQYATHVQWAVIQTKRIAEIYDSLDNYILVFDVPKFVGGTNPTTPPSTNPGTTEPEPTEPTVMTYPDHIVGVTNTAPDSLNFRDKPNGTLIASIPHGSKVDVLGIDGEWLNITYSGKTGWVHRDYVNILNLLEVTVSTLNVRDTPSTSGAKVGQIGNQYVAAVLDNNDSITMVDEWYQIYYNNNTYWISGGANATEYVRVVR